MASHFLPSAGLNVSLCNTSQAEQQFCQAIVRVQARLPSSRFVVRTLRVRVTAIYRRAGFAMGRTVHAIGNSTRDVSRNLRLSVQRRIAVSVCCHASIQSNIIAQDIQKKFPNAVVERRISIVDRGGKSKPSTRGNADDRGLGDLVDFLVLDKDGPKLVYEGCVETEHKVTREIPSTLGDREFVEVNHAGETRRVEVTHALKFKACVKWDTGEVSYNKL